MKKNILSITLSLIVNFAFAQWQNFTFANTFPINCIAAQGDLIVAGTQNGIFYSYNGGGIWESDNTGLSHSNITALVFSGPNIICSTDSGTTAYRKLTGTSWIESKSITAVSFFKIGNLLWAKGLCATLESKDDGISWKEKSFPWGCYKNFVASNNKIYHGDWAGPRVSKDTGTTWTSFNDGYSSTSDFSLIGADQFGHIVCSRGGSYSADYDSLYYATDSINPTWHLTNGFQNHCAAITSFAGYSNIIFAGVNDTFYSAYNGVQYSLDGGATWSLDGNFGGVTCLAVDNLNVYAGTQNGHVCKKTFTVYNSINENNSIPLSAKIFPNPSNGKFQILVNSNVGLLEVEVYNLIGEKVYQSKSQIPTIELNLSSMVKGIYLVRIKDSGKVFFEKILIQ